MDKEKMKQKLAMYEEIEQYNNKQIELVDSDSLIHTEQQLKDLGIDPIIDNGDGLKGGKN